MTSPSCTTYSLAFLAKLAGVAAAHLSAEVHVVGKASGLRLDEAALEVRVDDARRLRGLSPDGGWSMRASPVSPLVK